LIMRMLKRRHLTGIIGIKVWIFKGEIMEHDPQARDRRAQELQDGPAPRGASNRR
jgi:small subunit ribosomal protein S3